jgi:hypothetical protein
MTARKRKKGRPGRVSLYQGKLRELPVSITLPRALHRKVKAATARLGITRNDLLALLIDKFSAVVELPPDRPHPRRPTAP